MKKTYIKITALICALIMVAIALGGILFTLIRINDANAEFIKKVTKTNDDFNISKISIESEDDIQSTMIVFNGLKYLSSRTDPDIGHYGRYNYMSKSSVTAYESTNYNQVHFCIEFSDSVNEDNYGAIFSSDEDGSIVISDHGDGAAVLSYSVSVDGWDTLVVTAPSQYDLEDDEQTDKGSEKQLELDIEAKDKFDELI